MTSSTQRSRTDLRDSTGSSESLEKQHRYFKRLNVPSSVFPNPNRDERVLYAEYWQKKLAGKDIAFPDSLTKEFADETEGFSFSYLKEAFVSTLIVIATDESTSLVFRDVLFAQIKALRKELESSKGDDGKEKVREATGQKSFMLQ